MLIQVLAPTGNTVYILIWNSLGKIWNTATNLFEAYNPANYANYAIVMLEQAGSGSYFVNVPTPITAASGLYTFAGYVQLGGTPATGDTHTTPGSFTIPGPSLTGMSLLISSIRTLAQDTSDSKTVWQETLGSSDQPAYPVNGSNNMFRLKKAPLADLGGIPFYIWYTVVGAGSVVRSQTGITVVDPVNGMVMFSTPPAPGGTPPNGVYVDYNYVWFTDSKYTEFLNRAAQMTIAGSSGPLAIIPGLYEAMLQYTLGQFWYARASQYAEQYATSGGEAREDVQTVCQAYQALGKAAYSRGDYLKKDFYQRQGQRDAPAFGDITHGFDPITPIR